MTRRTAIISAFLVWTLGSASGFAAELDKLRFTMCWTASGSDTPYFLGVEKGFFRDQGIDLELQEVLGSGTCFQLLGRGEVVVATPDYGALTRAVAEGINIKAVFGVFQKSPNSIVSHADKPIKTPKELEGRMVAFSPAESTALVVPALLERNDVDQDKIHFVQPAAGAKVGLFLNRSVDAITAHSNVQLPVLARKTAVHSFHYADFGVNVLANGIAANADWLSENGELMRRLLKGVTLSWQAAIADPEASVRAMLKHKPDQSDQFDVFVEQLKLTFPLLQTENTKDKPLGWMAAEDWTQTRDLMAQYGGLKEPLDVDRYYTNEYVGD